jgi:hypothetical protein
MPRQNLELLMRWCGRQTAFAKSAFPLLLRFARQSHGRVRILGWTLQSTEKSVLSERFIAFGNLTSTDIQPR